MLPVADGILGSQDTVPARRSVAGALAGPSDAFLAAVAPPEPEPPPNRSQRYSVLTAGMNTIGGF